MSGQDLVLWDGDCGFCRRGMVWFKRRDREDRFDMVPYQDAPWPPMTEALHADCAKAMWVICADGTRHRGGRAVLHLAEHTGFRRLARVLALPPLIWLVEAGYWVMARNRYVFSRVFFRREPGDGSRPV